MPTDDHCFKASRNAYTEIWIITKNDSFGLITKKRNEALFQDLQIPPMTHVFFPQKLHLLMRVRIVREIQNSKGMIVIPQEIFVISKHSFCENMPNARVIL